MKKKELLTVMVCYASYMAIYFARLNLSSASPQLLEAGVLTAAQVGLLGSAFSAIYALGRLVNGNLSDRFSPRLMLSLGLTAASLGNILFGLLPPFPALLVLWSANALGQSMLWGAILSIVSASYPVERGKRVISVISTSASAGMLLSVVAMPKLLASGNVRFAFLIPGGFTLLCAAAAAVVLRKLPRSAARSARPRLLPLLHDREILTMAAPAVLHGCMKESIPLWMTLYFVRQFNVDLETSSYYVLFIPLAGFLARLICPQLLRLFRNSEQRLSVTFFFLCILASAGLCAAARPVAALLCMGLLYIWITVINTMFVSVYPLNKTGCVASVGGLMDFLTYLGASIASPIYGLLIDTHGFRPMFLSWAVISALCMLILLALRRRAHN